MFDLQREDKQDAAALLNPAERVAAVRPMWEQRQHDARVQLLTIDLETLRQQAKAVADRQRASAGRFLQQQAAWHLACMCNCQLSCLEYDAVQPVSLAASCTLCDLPLMQSVLVCVTLPC